MLVWKAMPSIRPVISEILPELVLILSMVPTIACTASLPSCARLLALDASVLAWAAFSAVCLTVSVSCVMLDAVSSSEAACCSVRADRSTLPAAISCDATVTDSAEALMPRTVSASWRSILRRAISNSPNSPCESITISVPSVPPAIWLATSTARLSGREIARSRYHDMAAATATPAQTSAMVTRSRC